MFRLLLAMTLLAALAGTGCSPAARLVGKWEADFEQARAEIGQSGNPLAAMAAGMMELLKVEIEFKSDGTMAMSGGALGQSQTTSGTWRYTKTDGRALVLTVQVPADAPEQSLRVIFTDNDHCAMTPPGSAAEGEGTLPFRRVTTN